MHDGQDLKHPLEQLWLINLIIPVVVKCTLLIINFYSNLNSAFNFDIITSEFIFVNLQEQTSGLDGINVKL